MKTHLLGGITTHHEPLFVTPYTEHMVGIRGGIGPFANRLGYNHTIVLF